MLSKTNESLSGMATWAQVYQEWLQLKRLATSSVSIVLFQSCDRKNPFSKLLQSIFSIIR